MRTDELDYHLPENLIATRPAEPRDSARMMVLHRSDDSIEHARVRDLPQFLRSGDAIVINRTAVLPARLLGHRRDTGGRIGGLFLHELAPGEWLTMLRSNSKLRPDVMIELLDIHGRTSGHALELVRRDGAQWVARLRGPGTTEDVLDHVGLTPLPPYILRARRGKVTSDELDRRWYQTVYADVQQKRSVAAPTAGLHFTPDLLDRLDGMGVERLEITLHVGAGTFKPIDCESVEDHPMHREHFEVDAATFGRMQQIRRDTRPDGPRIMAVGTTTVRTLESMPDPLLGAVGSPTAHVGKTDLLICPPYRFRVVDGMLTNFHLPRSTLLALVAAMIGLDRVMSAYEEAVRQGYRFYSYGDAMLILP